jgi:nitrite reductase/ring-hydroxylating ferredoxin subunit
MSDITTHWACMAKRNQITADTPLGIDHGECGVGIYEVDGELFAVEDVCPHAYALLSQGFVQDGKVECPLHGAIFDIKTGECLEGPSERGLHSYPVEVRGDDVYIQIKSE